MNKNIKKMIVIICISVLFTTAYSSAYAASGYQGYAIYRDGAIYGLDWHAGMMDKAYSTDNLPVLHHAGSGSVVKWDSWNNFMKGKNFKGVYTSNDNPASYERDSLVAMGRNLRTENIPYNLAYQVYYNTGTVGAWVSYDEISSMRCDGVVEYVHEWYSHRVYGNDAYWDVTHCSVEEREHHSGTLVTPKKQKNYLTLVTSNVP